MVGIPERTDCNRSVYSKAIIDILVSDSYGGSRNVWTIPYQIKIPATFGPLYPIIEPQTNSWLGRSMGYL